MHSYFELVKPTVRLVSKSRSASILGTNLAGARCWCEGFFCWVASLTGSSDSWGVRPAWNLRPLRRLPFLVCPPVFWPGLAGPLDVPLLLLFLLDDGPLLRRLPWRRVFCSGVGVETEVSAGVCSLSMRAFWGWFEEVPSFLLGRRLRVFVFFSELTLPSACCCCCCGGRCRLCLDAELLVLWSVGSV